MSDKTEGLRICLKCGTKYYGVHTICPHKKSEIAGFIELELAKILMLGLNER